ncbi:MAG: RlmE family RNA methyltransferase, partial [Desulfobacterales bacterium]
MKRNRWDDHYSITARRERFPARSVYKLKEIQKKYRIIQPGHKVLDLGCSPGSWLLYAASQAGPGGEVIGFDLKPVSIQVPPNVSIHTGDILSLDQTFRDLIGNGFNVTLSDMAPDTTGNKNVDAARSF